MKELPDHIISRITSLTSNFMQSAEAIEGINQVIENICMTCLQIGEIEGIKRANQLFLETQSQINDQISKMV